MSRKISANLLALLVLSVTLPLLSPTAYAQPQQFEAEIVDQNGWKIIKTDVITILFPADGRKPMFIWWYTKDPKEAHVVKYQGLWEYLAIKPGEVFKRKFKLDNETVIRVTEELREEKLGAIRKLIKDMREAREHLHDLAENRLEIEKEIRVAEKWSVSVRNAQNVTQELRQVIQEIVDELTTKTETIKTRILAIENLMAKTESSEKGPFSQPPLPREWEREEEEQQEIYEELNEAFGEMKAVFQDFVDKVSTLAAFAATGDFETIEELAEELQEFGAEISQICSEMLRKSPLKAMELRSELRALKTDIAGIISLAGSLEVRLKAAEKTVEKAEEAEEELRDSIEEIREECVDYKESVDELIEVLNELSIRIEDEELQTRIQTLISAAEEIRAQIITCIEACNELLLEVNITVVVDRLGEIKATLNVVKEKESTIREEYREILNLVEQKIRGLGVDIEKEQKAIEESTLKLKKTIMELVKAWRKPSFFPFDAGRWELDGPYNITVDGRVIGVAFAFELKKAHIPFFKFAEDSIIIRNRLYYVPVEETVGNITYTVVKAELKSDIIIKRWDWNVEALLPLIRVLKEEFNVTLSPENAGLALWLNLASLDRGLVDKIREPEDIELYSELNEVEVADKNISVQTPRYGIDEEKPIPIDRKEVVVRFKTTTENETLAGFFKFVATAKIEDQDGVKFVPVSASYIEAGRHLQVFVSYPYFGNGSLEHDPSIGLEVPETTTPDATTPQYSVSVPTVDVVAPTTITPITAPAPILPTIGVGLETIAIITVIVLLITVLAIALRKAGKPLNLRTP